MKDHYPPIGVMKTCFSEKFGTPRQSLMIPDARGVLKLNPNPNFPLALTGLETFSHLWIIFVFHQHAERPWHPMIRPPRVEGMRKVGVFASRSPHRPNPIGISAVKLDRIDREAPGGVEIHLSGVDLLDGTPVLDIKPYLPYADQIPDANQGWAREIIRKHPVKFSQKSLDAIEKKEFPRFRELLEQMLALDPRPTSQRRSMPIGDPATEGRVFGFRISDVDVQWRVEGLEIHVIDLIEVNREETSF